MRVYLVSFPDDIPTLRRLRKKKKKEILVSYFFLLEKKGKSLREILKEMEEQKK